ncbi:ATP-binding cassette domain-containing protein [Pseudoalteromonas luteoviolacea]|uniref:ABC transporter domain-containing protein n=1 Tax=Pseudoalteromonas luteoviolacea DSM 6061 TaxID=1365250 RepID=A0A166X4T4_9GAMM|nr:ATP-binding cassette domain-containing protein [Pseudoalteromonas luteoviolacea]KZN39604.1 hypothetical protein N475_14405 [Pseudoalteromonas luteoviolacea DSM 6061]MBE0388344.1 ribose transport system ATP-binding protein [Pseudoalteromonas luteoviolacea DSM 6061]
MIRTQLDQVALNVVDLHKQFSINEALKGVSFTANRGEVVALLGDNGAGKSTLVNCIAGKLEPSHGEIQINGRAQVFSSPSMAQASGIAVVYQDLALVKEMTVVENLFLNNEIKHRNVILNRLGWLDKKAMLKHGQKLLQRLTNMAIDLNMPVSKLSIGQQQVVALIRAVNVGADIIVMDEPTTALGNEQYNHVAELIRLLSSQGVTILLVSHNLVQVKALCDRAVVLFQGQSVADVSVSECNEMELLALINGVMQDETSVRLACEYAR